MYSKSIYRVVLPVAALVVVVVVVVVIRNERGQQTFIQQTIFIFLRLYAVAQINKNKRC